MLSLKERLTELLINNKLITPAQLEEALKLQQQKGGRLSDIVVELKFVKENDLMMTLSQGLGLPLMDLKRFKIDYEIAKIIPSDIARRYQIIPIAKMGDTITVAMADPLNIFAIDHVQSLTGHKINPIIATAADIMQTIELSYPDSTGGVIDSLVKEISTSSVEVIKEQRETTPSDQELDRISRDMPVIKITNMLLEEGVRKRASDILIEPLEKKLRVRLRLDGILQEQAAPPKSMHPSIVSRIKVMSNLNIAEHRLPQDGRFKVKMSGKEIDFRVSVVPASMGEKVAIRILDKTQATLDLVKLGFTEKTIQILHKVARMPHGMMLVCGPTGSGKTTTLYSILKHVDSPEKNLITVEDPVEYQLEGINQVSVRPDIGLTFAGCLRSILRQDPNVIMVGEIRDFETVDIAIKSALTGHLVLSTLHTTTAPGAIVRMVNMGVEPYLINSAVVCVVAQRLVRKVCTYCREHYELSSEALAQMRIPAEALTRYAHTAPETSGKAPASRRGAGIVPVSFFRGKGCPRCFSFGYSGRVVIAEVLVLTATIREMILGRAQEHVIKKQARAEGMQTLRENGLELALKGITSLEEVIRVTAPDD